ncbi:MAG: hypothetical protein IJN27_02975 [Oscillospiraceae bacterium]|nr:hypothetical protein [Oscillospiraceae bacterium]
MTNNNAITTKDVFKKSNCMTLETKILGNFTIDGYDDFPASRVILGVNCFDPNNLILHTFLHDEKNIKLKTWENFDYCEKLDFYNTPMNTWIKQFIVAVYSNMTRFLYYRYNVSCKFSMSFTAPKILDSRYIICADADVFSDGSCFIKVTINDSKMNNYIIQKFKQKICRCEDATIDDIEYIVREIVVNKLNTELDIDLFLRKEKSQEV